MSPLELLVKDTPETPKPMVLNLWVVSPLGIKGPFHKGHLRPLENAGICILIHDSGKTTVLTQQWKQLYAQGSL